MHIIIYSFLFYNKYKMASIYCLVCKYLRDLYTHKEIKYVLHNLNFISSKMFYVILYYTHFCKHSDCIYIR